MTAPLDPNHPMLLKGRREARDLLASAERILRKTSHVENAAMISLAMQLTLSAAMTDGASEEDAFNALAGSLLWAVNKLAPEGRLAVFDAMASGLRDRIASGPELVV